MHLEFQNIHKYYGRVRANEGIDLTLEPGRIYGLLGENGAGKSTLLHILGGLDNPDAGRVVMDGEAKDLRENEDVKEFYLGLSGGDKQSFRDVKSYKRRKRWM